MTYASWILNCRRQSGDTYRRTHVDWIGDGSTNVFQMPADTFPVLDDADTYVVKVAGSTQTETTQYTLDKDTGTLTFVSTPTNGQAVTIDCIAVYLTDADWLQVTNDVIRSLGDDFFKEFVDETLESTANMISLDLTSAQPNCIAVYDWMSRESSSDDWRPVASIANWRYDRDNNKLYSSPRDAFPNAGEEFRIRGLKTFTIGDGVDDDLDVPDRFLTILEYGCQARYWRWSFKRVTEIVSKISTENTRTPLQELIMLSDRFDRLFEIEKAKLKPQKPARIIPVFQERLGRV